MQKLLIVFVLLLTVLINYTVDAQQLNHRGRFNAEYSPPAKLQKAVLDPLPAGTYTIGTGGSFETVQDAFNKLSADGISGPVTLELIDDHYTAPSDTMGFRLIGPIPGAGENNRVTLKPASGKNVMFEGDKRYIITFENTSYFDLDGVSTEGATTLTFYSHYNASVIGNRAVLFVGDCDHNVIQNLTCIGDDIYRYGDLIVMGTNDYSSRPDSNLIQNNFIKKGGGCILISGFDASRRAVGNIIRNNKVGSETDSLISWGIQLQYCEDCIIENNIVQNLKVTTTYGSDIALMGINCYCCYKVTARNNVVHNIKSSAGYTSTGILLSGWGEYGNNNLVYNNMVYDINSSSTVSDNRVAGIQVWFQVNPKIYYNTVYLSGRGSNKLGSAAFYLAYSSSGVDLRNNILVNTRDEAPYVASAVYSVSNSSFTSDYNNLYCPSNQYNCLVRIGSAKFNTLAFWQATNKDLHSVTEMPNFIDPYLHIDPSIPTNLEKRGIPIADITTDFDGDLRNANLPDIGADEFNGISPSGPLALGTYSVGSKGFFPTIQKAFSKLSTDGISGPVTLELIDNMYFAPTDSFGFKLVGPVPGVNENSRLTIKPALNKNVQVQGNGGAIISFFNTSYVTIDGNNITGATTLTFHSLVNNAYVSNNCVDFLNNSDHNVIQNIIFVCDDIVKYGWGTGFFTLTGSTAVSDSNQILNNFFKKGHFAVYISSYNTSNPNWNPTGNLIKGNLIGSETDSLINCGIQLENCRGTIVENNIIQNFKYTSPSTSDVINYGINSYWGHGDIIRNNILHNIKSTIGYTSTGILLSGYGGQVGSNNLVYNNIVYDIQSTSAESDSRVAGIQIWNQTNPKIYYNTVYLSGNGANHLGSAAFYVYNGWGSSSGVELKNNIFVNTRDEATNCASTIYCENYGIMTDYNNLYCPANQYNCLVKIGVTKYNTLANWQATQKDLHSVCEMPNFVDSFLHINETIPTNLEKHGTPIAGIETDFDGETRHPTNPDIGADEFNGIVVGIEKETILPTEYSLAQNYPNPFNPSTNIKYSIPNASKVTIKIYDVLGKEIETLVNEEKSVGTYELRWNASGLSSGIYFYQLKSGEFIQTRKMILLK